MRRKLHELRQRVPVLGMIQCCRYKSHLFFCQFLATLFHSRLKELEELYEAKCREGKVKHLSS